MAGVAKKSGSSSKRVAEHRRRLASQGKRRLEVVVPEEDASLVKDLANALCHEGDAARELRRTLAPLLYDDVARTGRELIAFFKASPLADEDLDLERDKSPIRDIDFP